MNKDLIVEYKYAYFHHDKDDVQENHEYFVGANETEGIVLCHGDECWKEFWNYKCILV